MGAALHHGRAQPQSVCFPSPNAKSPSPVLCMYHFLPELFFAVRLEGEPRKGKEAVTPHGGRGVQRRREQAESLTMCHVSSGSTSCGIGERFHFSVECTKSPFGLWTAKNTRACVVLGGYILSTYNQPPPRTFSLSLHRLRV